MHKFSSPDKSVDLSLALIKSVARFTIFISISITTGLWRSALAIPDLSNEIEITNCYFLEASNPYIHGSSGTLKSEIEMAVRSLVVMEKNCLQIVDKNSKTVAVMALEKETEDQFLLPTILPATIRNSFPFSPLPSILQIERTISKLNLERFLFRNDLFI
ncbi:hypothetical protein SDJN03_12849, partial [Cucurbita argyrosperma subsp. sororia]